MFAETVLRQLIELLHGGKILSETRGLRAAAETPSLAVLHHQPPAAASLMRPLESWMRSYGVGWPPQRKYERLKPTRHADQPP
jgi:hypothetical protein